VSALYLIRHGQAGSRTDYDCLSEVGREQARRAGAFLASQGAQFTAVYAGALNRQLQTAEEARRAFPGLPAPVVEPLWNEFDLELVCREVTPRLAADDPDFRRRLAEIDPHDRNWNACDIAIVRAWIEGRYAIDGESWEAFGARIREAVASVRRHGPGEAVAVFTSATPMAIATALSLGVTDGHIMKLAGVTYNAAVTTLRVQPDDLTLFLFNSVAHLPPELRTYR
jgi:broad specificity phosphatase PhoE